MPREIKKPGEPIQDPAPLTSVDFDVLRAIMEDLSGPGENLSEASQDTDLSQAPLPPRLPSPGGEATGGQASPQQDKKVPKAK